METDEKAQTSLIGPAGENLSQVASIMNDRTELLTHWRWSGYEQQKPQRHPNR
jgi:hypothetical protein